MRSLLVGCIGAVAATAAWLAVEHFTQSSLSWLSCLVGLATGLGVRWASDADISGAVKRGALSVALTLAAILLGPQVYVKIMEVTLPTTEAIVTEVSNLEPAAEQNEPEASESKEQPKEEQDEPAKEAEAGESPKQDKPEAASSEPMAKEDETLEQEQEQVAEASSKKSEEAASVATQKALPSTQPRGHYSQWDMLWMCLAALAAYVTGKNSGETPAAVSADDASDATSSN